MEQPAREMPLATHVVGGGVVGPVVLVYLLVDLGLEPGGEWWVPDGTGWMGVLALGVATVGLLAALVETALSRFVASRWPARAVALGYVALAALVASFPLTFSLTGDPGPVKRAELTLYAVGFPLLVLGQLLLAWGLSTLLGAAMGRRRRAA
jgi:hypothetical protein